MHKGSPEGLEPALNIFCSPSTSSLLAIRSFFVPLTAVFTKPSFCTFSRTLCTWTSNHSPTSTSESKISACLHLIAQFMNYKTFCLHSICPSKPYEDAVQLPVKSRLKSNTIDLVSVFGIDNNSYTSVFASPSCLSMNEFSCFCTSSTISFSQGPR